jgi:TPR repeat protein
MKKKILTAEDCNKLAEENENNERENKFWKILAKMAVSRKDKQMIDEQEKQEMLNYLADEGESETALALKGNVTSQFTLGEQYYQQENFKEAFKWFWLAAQNGHAEAADYLSVMYANGEYVGVNYALSLQWCKIASNRGSAEAKEALVKIKNFRLN